MKWWEVLLEIVKYTAPALVVFFTTYYLLKEYLKNERQMRMMQLKQDAQGEVLPLRLQAYERLALFCERAKVPNLIIRLEQVSVTAKDLRAAMIVTIQQEYEHNIAQQIYVSKDLWKIIDLAKTQTVAFITASTENLKEGATAADFRMALFTNLERMGEQPMDTALLAIKKEVNTIL